MDDHEIARRFELVGMEMDFLRARIDVLSLALGHALHDMPADHQRMMRVRDALRDASALVEMSPNRSEAYKEAYAKMSERLLPPLVDGSPRRRAPSFQHI